MNSRTYLVAEFILLCLVLPTIVWVCVLAPYMFALLWVAALYCYLVFRFVFKEQLKNEWKFNQITWKTLKPVLIRWVIASLLITVFVFFYEPERLFNIPRNNPEIIPFLMLAYPVISALPQEFIFCSFFLRRYTQFLTTAPMQIIASALVFGYAHMLFINWIAPVFSFMAGLIFASTYIKTRSLSLVTLEHALYGNSIFLIGLGWYFYSGGVPSTHLING